MDGGERAGAKRTNPWVGGFRRTTLAGERHPSVAIGRGPGRAPRGGAHHQTGPRPRRGASLQCSAAPGCSRPGPWLTSPTRYLDEGRGAVESHGGGGMSSGCSRPPWWRWSRRSRCPPSTGTSPLRRSGDREAECPGARPRDTGGW